MGGFDIFYSVRNSSGTWGGAKNYGYPLNTPYDELFYCPSVSADSTFYFVSNRSNGFGGLDIYEARLLSPEPEPVVIVPEVEKEVIPVLPVLPPVAEEVIFYIDGKVTDSESGTPLQARINAIDIKSNETVASVTSSGSDGTYSFRVPEKASCLLELRAAGYLSDLKRVSVPAGYTADRITFNVAMTRVKVGKTVVLNNILFETGKAILTSGSYSELNRLLAFLQDNKGVKLEISGHTDNTGSEQLNARLSNERAKAVVMYLVGKGIEQSRISYKGFGSAKPVSTNATPQGRANNRRVEFKILEI
jgi:outer membrane protein OmpA-like peptidoglycan-associated protein